MEVITGDHNGWVLVSLSLRSVQFIPGETLARSDYTGRESDRRHKAECHAKQVTEGKLRRSMRRAFHRGHRRRGFKHYNGE